MARRRLDPDQKLARAIGINFPEAMKAKLVLLAQGDDRPVGWLVRQAVTQYLEQRAADIARYASVGGISIEEADASSVEPKPKTEREYLLERIAELDAKIEAKERVKTKA